MKTTFSSFNKEKFENIIQKKLEEGRELKKKEEKEKATKIPVPESLSDDGPSKDKDEQKDEEKP